MASDQTTSASRLRKNVEDVLLLGGCTAAAIYGILNHGALGLLVGSIVLSVAAAVVVRRETEVHDPADQPATDERYVADGGRHRD